ncbi:MAG: 4'-phosphopantetheinyl transferase superfamily protein [Oscillatoriales cyanobacterium C42_A2020_001]|nr:4'-phosphopantetheinyl transferase superfamily protein [Leptolyngbyaceae cyanobacterium C42_A2020_001]
MDTVVEIISVISGKERDRLAPDANLRSLGITSSIEILKIQSALERKFNQKLPPLGDTWTINKIAAQVGQSSSHDAEQTAPIKINRDQNITSLSPSDPSATLNVGGLFIGVDIEEVDHLPITSNYRTHDFYRSVFNDEEISYALLKPEARLHLCGIFCAKEALKKSAPELIQLRMEEIQVYHRQGRPLIKTSHPSIDSRFNFQVSISHSNHYAVATVLAIAK